MKRGEVEIAIISTFLRFSRKKSVILQLKS